MRKYLHVFLLIFILIISACSSDDTAIDGDLTDNEEESQEVDGDLDNNESQMDTDVDDTAIDGDDDLDFEIPDSDCDLQCEMDLNCYQEGRVCARDWGVPWYPAVVDAYMPECSCECQYTLVEECESGCDEMTVTCY